MSTENKELMQQAKESLKGKWDIAIVTFLVYMLISGIVSSMHELGSIISLVISGPFAMGLAHFSLNLSRNQEAKIEQIFDGFKDFKRTLLTYLLMLWNIFIRLLLFIVPGIIASFWYTMSFYILAENREITPKEALEKSKTMMDGYKLKFFYLGLRLLPLLLLCILTLGIGLLWFIPYTNVTCAKFYDDIKEKTSI